MTIALLKYLKKDSIINVLDIIELVNEIITMVDRNEYKRQQAAPGIKITSKNFGRDRRMPISNRFRIN